MSDVRFQVVASAPAVAAKAFSRVTARSASPPPHPVPWLIIMMCADRVAIPPTSGRLPIARSYRSASVGSIMNCGPFSFGFWMRPFTRRYSSTIPLCIGNAPVPISACPVGVFEGDEPTVTWSNQAPSAISDFRYGQSFFHVFSTSRPPESQISVTSSLGAGRSATGNSACVCAWPSGAAKSKCSRAPSVGARSASVIALSYTPGFHSPARTAATAPPACSRTAWRA